jgi:hypothetical protein
MTSRRRFLKNAVLLGATGSIAACAGVSGRYAPRVHLAGIESLPGEGLELRFMLKLRVQNPGETDLRYDGVWVDVELADRPLASGGAPLKGVVPRFGEDVIMLPVAASGLSIARQVIGWINSPRDGKREAVPYVLRGRLGGTGLASGDFESRGEINLHAML